MKRGCYRPSDRHMTVPHTLQLSSATSCLHWDTLEVSVRSISSTVLTFSTWLLSLVFLCAAFSLLNVSACSVILRALSTHSWCEPWLTTLLLVCQAPDLEEVTALILWALSHASCLWRWQCRPLSHLHILENYIIDLIYTFGTDVHVPNICLCSDLNYLKVNVWLT